MSGRGSERILLVIEWLATQVEPTSFTDVVDALDLPKSSALGLLRMLVELGYVEKSTAGLYRLVRLPGEAMSGLNKAWGTLLRLIDEPVRKAVKATGESGYIAVSDDALYVHYLNKILPEREIRYDRDITTSRLLHQVSSGLVLLSGFSDKELSKYTEKALSEYNINLEVSSLTNDINKVRKQGYYVNRLGIVEGAAGVAAPIFDADGVLIAALNIAGPREQFLDNLDSIIELTCIGAKEASESLSRFRSSAWRTEK